MTEYSFFELDKPTVKLVMSVKRRLICIICAHPLPLRIQWWWNTRKERDDNIHQINIKHNFIENEIIGSDAKSKGNLEYKHENNIQSRLVFKSV